jgi:fibronectin-binding autotransporter adhesin
MNVPYPRRAWLKTFSPAKLVPFCLLATAAVVFGEANYVYHERTTNDVTGGAANTCGGAQAYVPTLNPSSAQTYTLRFKAEFQFFTDTLRVYYTTNGTTPSGTFGTGTVGTFVVSGSYQCTFTSGANQVDVGSATLPAFPAGTVVKYIISAWHSGGGLEIFANGPGTPCACGTPTSTAAQATVFQYTVGSTTDLYWDSNGATAGAGATPTGTWGTSTFWSTVFDGTAATAGWTAGRNAIFSAGADATTAYTVTVSGTQAAASLVIEEGTVSFGTGVIDVGAGNVTVKAGATISTDGSTRVTSAAGSTLNVNGGTWRTTHAGNAGTFFDQDFLVTVGAAGATFAQTTTNINTIIQDAGAAAVVRITGPGGVTKTGIGVISIAAAADYQGPTIINDGELRIRTTANRLPINTAVTINGPGILNLNNVSQIIGSLSGNGRVGLGGATLTFGDASDTIFSGSISNIANYGASAVTTGSGRISKQGAGSITFLGSNGFTGSVTNNAGTMNVATNAILCDAVADLVVNGGTVNFSNAFQNVLSISGAGGAINLGPGHTLYVSNSAAKTYSGSITGTGTLVKNNTGTLTLSGSSSYDGVTFVNLGVLSLGSANGLGSTVGHTEVAAGAELLVTGAGSTFTTTEPIKIAGAGGTDGGAIAVIASASPTFSGPITLAGDATLTVSSSASATFNNPASITSLANQNLTLQGGANASGIKAITGTINLGNGSLTKLQGGEWVLSGANVYNGGTTVGAGTLRVANTTGSATGSGAVSVVSGAALAGPGIIAGAVSLGGTISPGVSPGTLASGSQTWSNGASYTFEINDATGTAGANPGWDLVSINGALTIAATPASKFNVNVSSLTLANVKGPAANFNNAQSYTWAIATASGGITGFDTNVFNLNVNSFSNAVGAGVFRLEQSGNSIVLRFIANQAPIANNLTAATITNQPVGIPAVKLLNRASDADGDPLTLSVSATSTNGGTVSLASGTVSYTPVAGFAGTDAFTYTVTDPLGAQASALVIVTVGSGNSVSLNVVSGPTLNNGVFSVRFAGVPGYTYSAQWAPAVTGPWTTFTNVVAGTNGLFDVTEDVGNPGPTERYYRTTYP